jgi:hypothetical protein
MRKTVGDSSMNKAAGFEIITSSIREDCLEHRQQLWQRTVHGQTLICRDDALPFSIHRCAHTKQNRRVMFWCEKLLIICYVASLDIIKTSRIPANEAKNLGSTL